MNGKGSRPRPFSVPKAVFDRAYERIFRQSRKRRRSGTFTIHATGSSMPTLLKAFKTYHSK